MRSVDKFSSKGEDPPYGGPKAALVADPRNDAPVLDLNGAASGTSTTVSYSAGNPLTMIAPAGTVVDSDSDNFNCGSLRVGFNGTGATGDVLAIATDAHVTLTGNDNSAQRGLKIDGTLIGMVSGGRNGTDLVIELHTTATPAQVQILLEHIGYANTSANPSTSPRTVTFTLVDGDGTANGGHDTGTASATITYPSSVNVAPVLNGDYSASVAEGGSYKITQADLWFTDPDDGPSGVTFTVSNLVNGTVKVNGVVATSFTGQQLLNGQVTFEHNGTETTAASFNVVVEDGNEDGSAPVAKSFNFAVTPVNDAPVVACDLTAQVAEGGSYTITQADLWFADPDDGPSEVTFTVSNLVNGSVIVNGVVATSFTGQQLLAGNVTFTHDGTETATASFNVVVEDGNEDGSAPVASAFNFTVTPVNDAPVLTGDLAASVAEGGSYVITAADLGFSDPDDVASGVTFTVSNPLNGVVKLNGAVATSFTGQQLLDGLVTFEHDGSETTAASFGVRVEDGNEDGSAPTASAFNFTVTPVNDAPVLTGDLSANVAEGGSYAITAADLGFSDPDNVAAGVTFTVSNPVNGTLKVNGVVATTFTGQQLLDGLVAFEHDGSETAAASFGVSVEDGDEDGSAPTASTFNFSVTPVNDAPVLAGDLAAEVAEGGSYTITAADLGFSDPDDGASDVTFAVSNPVNGTLKVNGVVATTFTGQQLLDGVVSFEHDGSETVAASFDVRVEDGNEDGSMPVASAFNFTVTPVNDAPVLTGDLAAEVAEGGSYTITAADLGFSDPDDVAAGVTFTTSSPTNGVVKVNGVAAASFTGQQLLDGLVTFEHDGSETTAASFAVSVEDGDEDGSAPAASTFNFTVTPVNDAPVLTGDLAAVVDEGGSYTITAADLGFSDPDDVAAGVTFTTSSPANGVVKVNGVAATSFTGQQLLDGLVSFEHDGSETVVASFDVHVEDGNEDGSAPAPSTFNFSVTPVNDAPVLTGDLAAVVAEGGTYTITAADLGFSDPDDVAADVTFTTSSSVNGTLKVDGVVTASFTGQQLLDGLVTFQHDGSETTAASFGVRVEDGNEDGSVPVASSFNFTVTPVNDAPVLTGDLTADVFQGGNYKITAADLGFSDPDDGASEVTFTVSNQVNGTVKVNGAVTTSFTGQQLLDGLVKFVHNGSQTATASFNVSVEDGNEDGSAPVASTFNFTVVSANIDISTLTAAQGFVIQGDAAGDNAGYSVSYAGDVNNDGYADVIVGAYLGDDGGTNAGEAYVVFGKASGFGVAIGGRQVLDLTGLSPSDGFIIQGDVMDDFAGWSVSSAGDVNGDGYADVIIGARVGDDGGSNAGEAYVVFGKESGFGTIDLSTLAPSAGFVIQGDAAQDQAGSSVASAGDVNGDGYDDLIVGAPMGDNGGSNAGEAYVLFGKDTTLGATFGTPVGGRQVLDLTNLASSDGFIIQGDVAGDQAGWSVASAGDVNGDGYGDVIVGARFGADAGLGAGEAYVVFGKASGFGTIDLTTLAPSAGFIIQGDAAGDRAGWSVSSAGDLNGDGFADVIVGAPLAGDAGEAYVVFGKASGVGTTIGGRQVVDLTTLSPSDGFVIQGDFMNDQLGTSVAYAGDINGDGLGDLIVGAPFGDNGGSNAGEAYVLFGKESGQYGTMVGGRQVVDLGNLSSVDGFIIQGDLSGDQAGFSVYAAGDVNNDGVDDLIVGAPNGSTGGVGEAYVIFGSHSWGP